MKRRLMKCERCKDETIHLVTKKVSVHHGSMRTRRSVKHCTSCNTRTITNMKLNKTYVKVT